MWALLYPESTGKSCGFWWEEVVIRWVSEDHSCGGESRLRGPEESRCLSLESLKRRAETRTLGPEVYWGHG